MEAVLSGNTDLYWLRIDAIQSRYGWSDEYVEDLPLERFLQLGRTIRIAQRIEDRRDQRIMAQVTYAIWFKDAGRKRPPWKRYLKKSGLEDEHEDLYLHRLEEEGSKAKRLQHRPQAVLTPDEQIEAQLEANEWGALTVTDLMEYKARKAERALEEGD